jgi:hypothetical protein
VKSENSTDWRCRISILFPIAWAIVLLFAIPAVQVLRVEIRATLSVISFVAFIVLARSVKGCLHLVTLPLWLLLAAQLDVVSARPISTQANWELARRRRRQVTSSMQLQNNRHSLWGGINYRDL